MAIAGVQKTAVTPLRSNSEQSGSMISLVGQEEASVTPVQDIRKGESQNIDLAKKENSDYKMVNTRFEFSVHEGTREIMVKVINEETNEIIREIPPEQILDMVAKMWELAGILVDKSV